jgi:hypothetical protein
VTSSLDELARREMKVLAHAKAVVGTMEDKERRLREDGTFAESAAIHAAYVDLAAGPWSPDALEALKRAVFLGWYATTEPSCFTGIDDLDEAVLQREFDLLLATMRDGRTDREFEVMLGWYVQVAIYAFVGRAGRDGLRLANAANELIRGLRMLDGHAYERFPFTRTDLEQRGQMGHYWISIVCRPH